MTKKKPEKLISEHPRKVGRPTKYSKALADRICDLIATSEKGYNRLYAMYDDIPPRETVNIWRRKYPEFRTMYTLAKAEQIENIIEEILDIADDGTNDYMNHVDEKTGCEAWRINGEHIQRSRIRIDTRKWLAAKLVPRIYGDAKEQESQNTELSEECKKRYSDMDKRNKKEF